MLTIICIVFRPVKFQANQEFYQASLTMATMPAAIANPAEEEQEEAEADYTTNNPYYEHSARKRQGNEESGDEDALLTAARLHQQLETQAQQSAFLRSPPIDQVASGLQRVAVPDETKSESTVMQGMTVPKEVAVIRKINRKRQFLEGTQEEDET